MIENYKKIRTFKAGCKRPCKGLCGMFFQYLSLMVPIALLYYLVSDLMNGDAGYRKDFYIGGCVICVILILVTTWFQYNGTFLQHI